MQPKDPARKALGHMFTVTFMELLKNKYEKCMEAKSQDQVDSAMVGIRRGLFAINTGLEKYSVGVGPFFEGTDFGIVEALTAPFVVRMLVNLRWHRGVDILAMEDVQRAAAWMNVIREHPAVVNTTPADNSLRSI